MGTEHSGGYGCRILHTGCALITFIIQAAKTCVKARGARSCPPEQRAPGSRDPWYLLGGHLASIAMEARSIERVKAVFDMLYRPTYCPQWDVPVTEGCDG